MQALEVAQAMDMALEVNDMATVLGFVARAQSFLRLNQNDGSKEPRSDDRPSFLHRFTASRVYATVCTLGVSILEREHRFLIFLPTKLSTSVDSRIRSQGQLPQNSIPTSPGGYMLVVVNECQVMLLDGGIRVRGLALLLN